MKAYFNPIFNIPKKTNSEKEKIANIDYGWLLDEAVDKKTRSNLKVLIAARKKFVTEGRYPYIGHDLLLRLKGCYVNARSNKPYSTIMVYKELFLDNEHQKAPGFDMATGTIVDIGANEGFYALKMILKNPDLHCICVEPSRAAYSLAKRNFKLNKLGDRVSIIRAAIWSTNDTQTLISLPANTSNAGLVNSPVHSPWLMRNTARREKVRTITLEELLSGTPGEIDILKVDAEGSELEILKGGISVLNKIKRVVVEYHSIELREGVIRLLENEGFNNILETQDNPLNVVSGNLYFVKDT